MATQRKEWNDQPHPMEGEKEVPPLTKADSDTGEISQKAATAGGMDDKDTKKSRIVMKTSRSLPVTVRS